MFHFFFLCHIILRLVFATRQHFFFQGRNTAFFFFSRSLQDGWNHLIHWHSGHFLFFLEPHLFFQIFFSLLLLHLHHFITVSFDQNYFRINNIEHFNPIISRHHSLILFFLFPHAFFFSAIPKWRFITKPRRYPISWEWLDLIYIPII